MSTSTGGSQRRTDSGRPVAAATEDAEEQGRAHPTEAQSPEDEDLTPEAAFRRSVEEGQRKLERPLVPALATGVVGGIDIGVGVLFLLVVQEATGSDVLAGIAFSVGFLALVLAQSELFTEGFLVPVGAVIARRQGFGLLLRYWGLTIVGNLVGGWVVTGLIMVGYPDLHATAIRLGTYFVDDVGVTAKGFALAMLAGIAITVMTQMQNGTESVFGKVVAALFIGSLLAGTKLFHSILDSLLLFAALHTGDTDFGYTTWAGLFAFSAVGNLVGGVGLVTLLRLLQVPHRVRVERQSPQQISSPRSATGWDDGGEAEDAGREGSSRG